MLNCPNCGAPVQSDICPYCGSVFLDWACFDMNRPTFVKIRDHRGHIVLMKLSPENISIEYNYDSVDIFADDKIIHKISIPELEINATFRALEFRDAVSGKYVLNIDIDPEKADEETKKEIILGMKNEIKKDVSE